MEKETKSKKYEKHLNGLQTQNEGEEDLSEEDINQEDFLDKFPKVTANWKNALVRISKK